MGTNIIQFKYAEPWADRRHFIDEEDVRVLLSRLPKELYKRLEGVYFKDDSFGGKRYGYTTAAGRREITLCALPPRISLTGVLSRYKQSHSSFGAIKGAQWPSLAVRRFMLYDVFLHELGHLQTIRPEIKNNSKERFANELKAQEFADYWREKLYSEAFDHPDPVHNPPSKQELQNVQAHWIPAHTEYKKGLKLWQEKSRDDALFYYHKALKIYPEHAYALEAVGIYNYFNMEESVRAMGFLSRAVQVDPTLLYGNFFLALSYTEQGQKELAIHHFEKSLRIDRGNRSMFSVYARALADWGDFEKAGQIFRKIRRKKNLDGFTLHNYKQFLLHPKHPDRAQNLIQFKDLFQPKDLKIKWDRISRSTRSMQIHYRWNLTK